MREQSSDQRPVSLPGGLGLLRALPLPRKLGLLEKLYGRSLSRHGITWIQASNGVEWKLDLRNPCHRWIVYGDYEGSVSLNWIRYWLRPGGVVVDSGANIGQMLLYLGPLPGIKVYAFEPISEAMDWLRECLARQRGWNVEIIPQGLHEFSRELEFLVAGGDTGHGEHSTLNTHWYGSKGYTTRSLPVGRLDDFLDARNEQRIRLWKLDVEGGEFEAIKGAHRWLADGLIDAIYVEINPTNFAGIKAYVHPLGYEIFRIDQALKLELLDLPPGRTGNFIIKHRGKIA